MKRGGVTAVSAGPSVNFEHDPIRKTLHNLQPTATDKENLVGGGRVLRPGGGGGGGVVSIKGAIKDEMSEKIKTEVSKKNRKIKYQAKYEDKSCQTSGDDLIKIDIKDLTCDGNPSENYWRVIAEKRRFALDQALKENEELNRRIDKLEEEKRKCEELLDGTRALVDILQEMVEGDDSSNINNSLDDSVL